MDRSKPVDQLIGRVLDGFGFSRADLATALEVTERSIGRWRAGKSYPQYESRARLDELDALGRRLESSFATRADAIEWLRKANGDLHGETPYGALLEDRIDAVERALTNFERGTARS